MSHTQRQKAKLLVVYILFYYAFSFFTNLKIGIKLLPTFPLLDLLLLLMIGSFIFLLRSNRGSIIYLTFWVIIFSVLSLTNTTMFNIYGDIFTTDYLLLLGEAADVFDWNFLNLGIFSSPSSRLSSLFYSATTF